MMSLDHLKKQAKNLHKLLPTFVQKHGQGAIKLSDCQELLAQVHGYGSWHSAVNRKARTRFAPVVLTDFYEAYVEKWNAQHINTDHTVKRGSDFVAMLYPKEHTCKLLEIATEELDEILGASEWPDALSDSKPSREACQSRIVRCERLLGQYPWLIDGYAHWAIGMFQVGEHRQTVEALQPVYDQLIAMLRVRGSDLRLPYSLLANRPIHRLAHSLVLANYKLATVEGAAMAKSVAMTMLELWPHDNIGFKYLLDGVSEPSS